MGKKNKMIVVPFDKKNAPKAVGCCIDYEGFRVLLAVWKRNKTENYRYGDNVKPEDVGDPVIGLGFKSITDWQNFVFQVNEMDFTVARKLKEKYQSKNGKGEDSAG